MKNDYDRYNDYFTKRAAGATHETNYAWRDLFNKIVLPAEALISMNSDKVCKIVDAKVAGHEFVILRSAIIERLVNGLVTVIYSPRSNVPTTQWMKDNFNCVLQKNLERWTPELHTQAEKDEDIERQQCERPGEAYTTWPWVKETAPTAARDWMLDAIKQAEEAEKKSEFHRDRIMEYAEAINSPSDGRKTVITFDQIFEAAEAGSARVRAAALFFTLVGWSGQINRDYDPRRYMHLFEDQRELQHRG